MKTLKLVFGLIMVLALISGSVVVAQEVDPPREEGLVGEAAPPDTTYGDRPMYAPSPPLEGDLEQLEAEKLQVMESLGILDDLKMMETFEPPVLTPEDLMGSDLVLPGDPVQQDSSPPVIPLEKEDGVREVDENATRAVNTESGLIYVANSFDDEWWPSVAHGGNYYMVVYAKDGNIYAKVYNNEGSWLYTHTVADYAMDCGYPSVAYEANSGLFLVAYEFFWSITDHDIWVQAVSPTTGNKGSSASAGWTLEHEWYPSVACNHISGTCLVAYQHNLHLEIKGMFFTLSSGGIFSNSEIYLLTGSTDSYRPYLAWGKGTGYYMLVYTYWDGSKDHPYYNKLYEAPVTLPGSQYIYPYAYVDVSNVSGPNKKYSSGVAYDPCTQKFVITFYHDYSNDNTDYDVWAVAKVSTSVATGATPFSAAFSGDNERDASISFVTDNHLTPACGSMDKLVVAYHNSTRGIMAADLRGNNSTTDPLYTRDAPWRHLAAIPKGGMNFIPGLPVAIASGSSWARMFIAGQPWWTIDPFDTDIWGRLVEVRERTYIPLTVR